MYGKLLTYRITPFHRGHLWTKMVHLKVTLGGRLPAYGARSAFGLAHSDACQPEPGLVFAPFLYFPSLLYIRGRGAAGYCCGEMCCYVSVVNCGSSEGERVELWAKVVPTHLIP